MTNLTNPSRRRFLKGAALVGAAAVTGASQLIRSPLTSLTTPKTLVRAQGDHPLNTMSADLPAVNSSITLHTPHVIKEIAPGVLTELWTYERPNCGRMKAAAPDRTCMSKRVRKSPSP